MASPEITFVAAQGCDQLSGSVLCCVPRNSAARIATSCSIPDDRGVPNCTIEDTPSSDRREGAAISPIGPQKGATGVLEGKQLSIFLFDLFNIF